MLYIYEVHLNHDSSKFSNDALNLRYNQVKNSYIKAPEWIKGQKPHPAAYALNKVKGGKVTIKARFAGGPGYKSLKIRAVDAFKKPEETLSIWENIGRGVLRFTARIVERALPNVIYLDKSGDNILGSVREKTIKFDSNGFSKLEEFELTGHRLNTSTGIGIYKTEWKWQYYENGTWCDFSKTSHKIYTLYDQQSNRQDVSSSPDSPYLPWADALEVACLAASGATNLDEIAKQITIWINEHPLLVYHPSNNFVAKGVKDWSNFNSAPYMLSLFLRELKGNKTFSVNCLDCANAVIALANLLGCKLVEKPVGIFKPQGEKKATKPIVAIGGDESKHSEWKEYGWDWHAFAWKERTNWDEKIYDACLKLDLDLNQNDTIHKPHHPVNMKYGLGDKPDAKDYVNYLLKNPSTTLTGNWSEYPVVREIK